MGKDGLGFILPSFIFNPYGRCRIIVYLVVALPYLSEPPSLSCMSPFPTLSIISSSRANPHEPTPPTRRQPPRPISVIRSECQSSLRRASGWRIPTIDSPILRPNPGSFETRPSPLAGSTMSSTYLNLRRLGVD